MTDLDLLLKKLAFIHGYTAVDLNVVRDVLAHHLDDIVNFANVIRSRLAKPA